MQPCAVCGGVTVNATGHCTQCGTFRGNAPQAPPGGYAGYPPPAAGPGYSQPMSGGPAYGQQPVSGYPMSAPPGAYPGSGGPAYGQPPTSGGGYPAAYPPPPGLGDNSNKAKPFVVPLVALSATLVVLVVAIVVVVLVRSGGDDPDTPVAGPTPTAGPTEQVNPDVDPCVVGRWRVSSHREDVPMDGVGEVEFTGGSGAIIDLAADGSGKTTYRGTTYEGTVKGDAVSLKLDGVIEFDFTARDGTVSFANMKADGTSTVYIAGDQVEEPRPLTGGDDPAKYTCSGTSMTQSTQLYETQLTKVG